MKTPKLNLLATAWTCLIFGILLCVPQITLAVATQPSITSIRLEKAEVIVTADVPAGIKKVTLEGRSRLGAGTWSPRAVARLDGSGGAVTFRLRVSAQLELLRVRADTSEPLPSSFYEGSKTFSGPANSGDFANAGPPAAPGAPTADNRNAAEAGGAARSVVESDIWKIRGNTLYFFNQYRGLQVIDLTTADSPVLQGTLDLPAAGEQMYLLDSGPVVLLARDGCGWGAEDSSKVLVVDASTATPAVIATLSVQGTIQESRMVGTALYVVSQTYRPLANSKEGAWEWGSLVTSFDLSNPANPAIKDTLWQAGYGNVINATDRFLFVVTQDPFNWWRSVVRYMDISSPDGTMKAVSSIKTSGRVPDKFKINLDEDTLTIISENWNTEGRGVFTLLETFSLANPSEPAKLGQLELARGEQLHATRFDGKRAYVVTFFRIDPLWVVDLSDPKNPRIAGELHVPGWSTYIKPLGDKLVSVGIADSNRWQVAVSLFDVKDPSKPTQLDKVSLGENHSWSEANYDEKAFSVLPEAGLILVPYQGEFSGGYASRVQLIDLGETTLKARGTIDHQFQPRRATVHGDRILSIAGNELLVVDASDRDKPLVKSNTELAWPVNKIHVQGSHLIEIFNGSGYNWFGNTTGSIRIAATDDPDKTLAAVSLKSTLPIAGAALKENRLYVAQGKPAEMIWPPWNPDVKEQPAPTTNPGRLMLTVFDVSQLPAVTALGQTETEHKNFFGGTLEPLWVRPGLLVWAAGGYYFMPWFGGIRGGPELVADVAIWRGPWWGGSGGGIFFAFDVTDVAAPSFASEVNLSASGNWWAFSSAFTADGLVYISHQGSEFLEGVLPPDQPKPVPPVITDPKTPESAVIEPPRPIGTWITRYYLDVIDYADAKTPTVRKPVNIPGMLQGLSHNGAVLYTTGAHWDANGITDWSEWLDASAYDGVSASLVTSTALQDWPHPILLKNGNVFVGRAKTSDSAPARLEVLRLDDAGKFAQVGSTELATSANTLIAFGDLLAVQQDRHVTLFDASNPGALVTRGTSEAQGCLWYDLKNADGDLTRGLWLPLNEYGVARIPLKPVATP